MRKVMSLALVLIMLLNIAAPTVDVFAGEGQQTVATEAEQNATSEVTTDVSAETEGATGTIEGQAEDADASNQTGEAQAPENQPDAAAEENLEAEPITTQARQTLAKDITKYVNINKVNVWYQHGAGLQRYYLIKDDEQQNDQDGNPITILPHGADAFMSFAWDIPEEYMSGTNDDVNPDDYFIFKEPYANGFGRLFDENHQYEIKNTITDAVMGYFIVANGEVKAVLNAASANADYLKDGEIQMGYKVQKRSKITFEPNDKTNQIKVEVEEIEKQIGLDGANFGKFTKGGSPRPEEEGIARSLIWTIQVNKDQLNVLTEGGDLEVRKNIWVEDMMEDPEAQIVESSFVFETSVMAMTEDNKVTNDALSYINSKVDPGQPLKYTVIKPNSGESYDAFKARLKASNPERFTIGLYPADKANNQPARVLVYFGSIGGGLGLRYGQLFNKAESIISGDIDNHLKPLKPGRLNWITEKQAELTRKAFGIDGDNNTLAKEVPYYSIRFKTLQTKVGPYVNTATVEWDGSKQGEQKALAVYPDASGKVGPGALTRLGVEKKWVGKIGHPVKIELIADGDVANPVEEIELNEQNNWKYTFLNLEMYRPGTAGNDSDKIVYTVKETMHPDDAVKYTTTQKKDSIGDIIITNTQDKIDLVITKKWIGSNNGKEDVHFDLYADGVKKNSYIIPKNDALKEWKLTIPNLPLMEGGKKIEYTVVETNLPADYAVTYEKVSEEEIAIYNIPKKDMKLIKKWDGKKEKCIRIAIYADGKQQRFIETKGAKEGLETYDWTGLQEHYDATLNNGRKNLGNGKILLDHVVIHTAKQWELTVGNLPKLNKDGSEIEYTAKETHISGSVNGNTPQPIEQLKEKYYVAPTEKLPNDEGFLFKNHELIKISVEKKWELNDPSTLNTREATFKLYKGDNGDEEVTEAGEVKITGNAKGFFKPVRKFDDAGAEIKYVVKEANVPGFTSKVEGSVEDGFVVTNTENTSVKVKKVWYPAPAAGENREVTFYLQKNGSDFKQITLNGSENPAWEYTFENLPVIENGQKNEYSVIEEKVTGYFGYGMELVGGVHQFVNVKETSVTVEKKWVGLAAHTVKLELLKGSTKVKDITLTSPVWKEEIKGLPAFEKDGSPITYTIKEVDVLNEQGNSIKGNYKKVEYSTENGVLTVTNTNTAVTKIKVEKKWNGRAKDGVLIRLLINDVPSDKPEHRLYLQPNTHEQFNWKGEFINLPIYDASGEKIKYTVKEENLDGYISDITGNAEDGFVVTNTELTNIKVKKVWYPAVPQGKTVTIKVTTTDAGQVSSKTYTLDGVEDQFEKPAWNLTINDLPAYNKAGTKLVYEVEEISVDGFISKKSGNESTGYTFTNIETHEIEVTKNWVGPVDPAIASVKVQLYRQITGGQKETVGGEVEIFANKGWKHTFAGLAKTDINGNEYQYSVDEVQVPNGYAKDVNGFTITNKNVTERSIKVKKVWVDDNDAVGKRPQSITINLKANGEQKDTVTLPKGTSWEHTFTGLRQYDDNGDPIKYTVEEVVVSNYNTAISGQDVANGVLGNEVTITNTIEGKVSIPVSKNWIGPKASVTVNLLADNVKVDSIELKESNNWQHTFTGKPEYKDGKKIIYTVEEVTPDGYVQTSKTGSVEAGFVFTNRNEATTKLEVEKKWVGPATEKVVVKLLADGQDTGKTVELNVGNSWKSEFTGLRKYHETDGHEIVYTVEEVAMPNYAPKYDNSVAGKVTITNTNTEKIEVPIEKKWLGDNAASATIHLWRKSAKDADALVGSITLRGTETEPWKHTFQGLDKYSKTTGELYEYYLKEDAIDGYHTSIVGFVVTNRNDAKINIPVKKVWVDSSISEVTVRLWNGDIQVGELKLNEGNKWMGSFDDLRKFDPTTGAEIKYTLTEDAVPNFSTQITGDKERGFVVTNTYIPPLDPYYPPGGDGEDDPVPPTPDDKPNPPTTTDEIPGEPTPQGDPNKPTPPTPTIPSVPEEEIPTDPIPEGKTELPKTDGIPAGAMHIFGLAMAAIGLLLKKKK